MKQFDYLSLAINIFGRKHSLVQLGMNASTQNLTHSSFGRTLFEQFQHYSHCSGCYGGRKYTEFGVCTLKAYHISDNANIEKL